MKFKLIFLKTTIVFFLIISSLTQAGADEKKQEPTNIRADSMKVVQNENITIFSGNVNVVKGKTIIDCEKLIVHHKNSDSVNSTPDRNSFKSIEAKGKVRIQMEDKRAKAENAIFNSDKEILILTGGRPEIIDSGNKISGDSITYFIKTGIMEVEKNSDSQVEATFINE
ncbi:MAG: lipopolysaccharide transport periplasmic protein LptA [Desulforegulaceae bacterium]|nr:lipopolysaccharide transport periplasmic protein LptA [Desulforegulaceae bacterium]